SNARLTNASRAASTTGWITGLISEATCPIPGIQRQHLLRSCLSFHGPAAILLKLLISESMFIVPHGAPIAEPWCLSPTLTNATNTVIKELTCGSPRLRVIQND